jgi:hypothetical protein
MHHDGRVMVVAGLFAATSAAHAASPSQCGSSEKVMFSCSTGAKVVSVCATGDLSSEVGSLTYRFGPLGHPEMTYPPSAWRDVTRSGTWAFSGGGGAWLAFHRDAFRYIVYTAIGRGWGEKSGVAVEQNGKLIANQPCRDKPVSEPGPDLFSDADIPGDDKDFELP